MLNDILKNFFGIRIEVKTHEKVILGIIPIFLILLMWFLATSGKTATIILPEGEFEGFEKVAPKVGQRFMTDFSYTVKDATIEENEDGQKWLIKDGQRYDISIFGTRAIGKNVRITLKAGKLLSRNLPELQTAPQTQVIASASTDASTASATDAPVNAADVDQTKKATNFAGTISYRFEVVETRAISQVILPSPGEVFRSLPSLWVERSLLTNILYSFLRVGAGFLVAFIVVFPVSLMMGTYSKFHALFSPLMMFGGYLPIPALVPLTMVLFGTTEQQKIMFLALGFSIYLLPLFVKALEEVDNVYLQTGLTLGARKFQILNKILLPIAMPKIYDAMRLGFGIGWGYIILAEMVDMGSKGVGTLILTSQRRGPREDIYLVLIAIVIMAFITDKIWEKIGDRLFPYRSEKR